MIFRLQCHADGSAFDPDPAPELARILRHVAGRIEAGESIGQYLTIHDSNGNGVGQFALKSDDYR